MSKKQVLQASGILNMADLIFSILLWIMNISKGLMAGIYFAFLAFILAALAEIPHRPALRL